VEPVKIFISSLIADYDAYRDAAERAVTALGHEVVRAEDFAAQAGTPHGFVVQASGRAHEQAGLVRQERKVLGHV